MLHHVFVNITSLTKRLYHG